MGASPAAAAEMMRVNQEIDITDILPTVQVPTLVLHREGDKFVNTEGSRMLADGVPGAKLVTLPGYDHMPFVGEGADEIVDLIAEFIIGAPPAHVASRQFV
jgi:pimeloyl-ACP methyl ester carboxylesterase